MTNRSILFLAGLCWLATGTLASAAALRIVTYNIDADTNGSGGVGTIGNNTSMTTVLQAIGQSSLNGNVQPPDVVALEELSWVGSGASPTLQVIVNDLDSAFPGSNYAYDPTYDPTDGNLTGNGPSGIVYNTATVKDLGAVAIGTASGSGAPRCPMRFELQPVGGSSSSQFYLYVSHADESTASRRQTEAQEIRNNETTLPSPASANVLYTGDYNFTIGEQSYLTYTGSGAGQGFDPGYGVPGYPTDGLNTESATSLRYRDDVQFSTGPVYNGTGGLQLVKGSYTVFGNNDSTGNTGSVTNINNTALAQLGLSNSAAVYSALTTATDHLPVVADYQFTPAVVPATISLSSALNARIMPGGTGTLGATITNSAVSGANNLNYTLAAAATGGSATLGTVTPGSDSLAPGASDANTVTATSTNLGINTITFTASDPNASNSPQTINATLTVVTNRVVTAIPVGFGVVHAGQSVSSGTVLSTTGDNDHYTAVTVPGGSDGLVNVQGTSTVLNADGQWESRTVTGSFPTAGLINNTISLATVGEGLPGEQPIPVQVSYSATVFSGSARWTGALGGSWGTYANWQDTQAAGVQAPPGIFAGFSDSAVLDDTAGSNRSITLDGASPLLSSLTLNTTGSGYTLSQGAGSGALQFSNGVGTATLSVAAGSHMISVPISFAGNGAINLAAQTQLTIAGNVSGSPVVTNNGMLVFGAGTQTVGAITGSGSLDVTGASTTTAVSVVQSSIEIDSGAKLSLSVSAGKANWSSANALSISGNTAAWTGDLDVGASGITLSNATSAEVPIVESLIKAGYAGGTWAGTTGITSSAANAYPSQTSIGFTFNASTGKLVIAAAITGDTDLSGVVNNTDRGTFAADFGKAVPAGVSAWQFGSFNYGPVVNNTDRGMLAANFGKGSFPSVGIGGGPISDPGLAAVGSGAAPVPEPGTLALLAAGLAVACIAVVRRRENSAA
ncbi:MAG: PEP-CTERM sorting domain-containing protein [Thermoguttaceae bacterium]